MVTEGTEAEETTERRKEEEELTAKNAEIAKTGGADLLRRSCGAAQNALCAFSAFFAVNSGCGLARRGREVRPYTEGVFGSR